MIDQQRSLLSPEKRLRDILAEGGDWVARDLGAARAALLKEHFARRAKANLQLLSSADALASQCSLF